MKKSKFKRYGNYLRGNETTWPDPDSIYLDELNWKLRYASDELSSEERVFIASVISAYTQLTKEVHRRVL